MIEQSAEARLIRSVFKNFTQLYFCYIQMKADLEGKDISGRNAKVHNKQEFNPKIMMLTREGRALIVAAVETFLGFLYPWERKIVDLYLTTVAGSYTNVSWWFEKNGKEITPGLLNKYWKHFDNNKSSLGKYINAERNLGYEKMDFGIKAAYKEGIILYPRELRHRTNVHRHYKRIMKRSNEEFFGSCDFD